MTIKKFSAVGQIESGVMDVARGRTCVFVAVVQPHGLGLAVANEKGYYPVPLNWCHGDNFHELSKHADELNAEIFGLDAKAAAIIACSTMDFSKPA